MYFFRPEDDAFLLEIRILTEGRRDDDPAGLVDFRFLGRGDHASLDQAGFFLEKGGGTNELLGEGFPFLGREEPQAVLDSPSQDDNISCHFCPHPGWNEQSPLFVE